MSSSEARTYQDYEEIGRYLRTAHEAVAKMQGKCFDMFGGAEPLTEGTVTMETRPVPTSYDKTILELVLLLQKLRSELATEFYAEVDESEVLPS